MSVSSRCMGGGDYQGTLLRCMAGGHAVVCTIVRPGWCVPAVMLLREGGGPTGVGGLSMAAPLAESHAGCCQLVRY